MVGYLTGWDKISAFLDVSIPTAQRMEKAGMPVYRDRGIIQIDPDEVRQWRKSQRDEKRGTPIDLSDCP